MVDVVAVSIVCVTAITSAMHLRPGKVYADRLH